jgi:hypothetical protein
MKKIFTLLFLSIGLLANSKHKLYLIAGHGSDIRIFSKINFPENVDTVHLHFIDPIKNETMHDYAIRISKKIDTTQQFSIMGVSLGGMLATEMTSFHSSRKCDSYFKCCRKKRIACSLQNDA